MLYFGKHDVGGVLQLESCFLHELGAFRKV